MAVDGAGIDDQRRIQPGPTGGDVDLVPVKTAIDQRDCPVDGSALRQVDRRRIGPGEFGSPLVVGNLGERKRDPAPVDLGFDLDRSVTVGLADRRDAADGAVYDTKFVIATEEANLIAAGQGDRSRVARRSYRREADVGPAQRTVVAQDVSHGPRHRHGGGVAAGKQQRCVAHLTLTPPGLDDSADRSGRPLGLDEATMAGERSQSSVGLATPEVPDRIAGPAFMLAHDLLDPHRLDGSFHDGQRRPANRLQLAGVTDEDDLGPCRLDMIEQSVHVAQVDQSGLVDDEDIMLPEELVAVASALEPARRGSRFDAEVGIEAAGHAPGAGSANHALACSLIGANDDGQRRGLAAARRTSNDRQSARPGGIRGGLRLFRAEAGGNRVRADTSAIELESTAFDEASGGCGEVLFGREDIRRGIAGMTDGLVEEALASRPGRDLVVERLIDVLLVEALRFHSESANDIAPAGLLVGLADPPLARALRLLHGNVAHGWSIKELAKEAGLSRTVFAERFSQKVGVPPMQYLMDWRMAVAKDMLQREATPLEIVAAAIGYQSASAFSTAFRREVGRPPSHFARAAA